MKKPLRRLLRIILKTLSRAVIAKHRPDIIAITGDGQTAIAREAVYTVLHGKFAVRRNLESPEAEFSVPLTIFGAQEYPRTFSAWAKVLLKTSLQLFILKPYKHKLVLELNAVNPEILNYWLEITQPKVLVVCGGEPPIIRYSSFPIRSFNVPEPKDKPLVPYLEMAHKLGRHYKMSKEEIRKALEKFELPQSRIRLLAGKQGKLIVDSTYYYLPPPLLSVLEILNPLPGKKVFILHTSLYDSEINDLKKIKVVSSGDLSLLKKYDVIVLRGPRRNLQSILNHLTM